MERLKYLNLIINLKKLKNKKITIEEEIKNNAFYCLNSITCINNEYIEQKKELRNITNKINILDNLLKFNDIKVNDILLKDFYNIDTILDNDVSVDLTLEEIEELKIFRVSFGYLNIIYITDYKSEDAILEDVVNLFGEDDSLFSHEELEDSDNYIWMNGKVLNTGGMLGIEAI